MRSFDTQQAETIQFNKPLTLIVGSNGSGKTTIIECLRYATTGDLPPNSKGAAFIHDPRITGERESKAQVKLAFQNCNSKNMILTKSIQLVLKPNNSSTFKTLENQLAVINHGERTTVSQRAAEVEQLIPQHLGVPKAVLNHVIFCHQEDNFWPISEASALKKRFDEIFDSVRFIKVLDNFKAINKDIGVDVKVLSSNVQHLKNDVKRANSKKKEMQAVLETVAEYQKELDDISLKIDRTTEESDQLFKSNQDFERILTRIESLSQQHNLHEQQIYRLEDQITPLIESDDSLQHQLTHFSDILVEKKKSLETGRDQFTSLKEELSRARSNLEASIRQEAQYKSFEEEYKSNLEKRQTLYRLHASEVGMKGDNFNLDIFVAKLQTKVDAERKTYNSDKIVFERREDRINTQMATLRDGVSREKQHMSYASDDLQSINTRTEGLKAKVSELSLNENRVEIECALLADLREKLEKCREKDEIGSIISQMNKQRSAITAMEEELEQILGKITVSNRRSESLARLSILKENIEHHTTSLTVLKLQAKKSFDDAILKTFAQVLKDRRAGLADARDDFENAKSLHSQSSNGLKQLTDGLHRLESELAETRGEVEEVLPANTSIDDYDELLGEYEEDYETALQNSKFQTVTLDFNTKAIQIAQSQNCCLLCRRGFDSPGLENFLELLSQSNEKLRLQNLSEEKDSIKRELDCLRGVSKKVFRVKSLTQELSDTKKKLLVSQHNAEETEQALRVAEASYDEARAAFNSAEAVKPTVDEIDRLEEEVAQFRNEVEAGERELRFYGVNESLEELQSLQSLKSSELKTLRTELSRQQDSRDEATSELNRMESSVKDKQLLVSDLERTLADKRSFERNIEDNLAKATQLHESISKSKGVLAKYEHELEEAQEQSEQAANEKISSLGMIQSRLDLVTQTLNDVQEIGGKISQYEKEGGPRLRESVIRVKDAQDKICGLEEHLSQLEASLKALEGELADADSGERNIRYNLELRSLKEELVAIEKERAELQAQNAESERDRYQAKANELRQKFTELKSLHSGKVGELTQLEKQAAQIKAELSRDYSKVEENFHNEYIKLQTKMFISNDLAIYSKALDNAVMKFHSIKMTEINRILDELWKKTYAGTDVDTIMIKSDVDTVHKNRSYNYRVVMVKQDVELDMRGRCSAGQKMLASIIIRLALAECFGVNCGVIALDEPTTNLDQENIESLARSLSQLIEFRKHQKNFQIIVITHDENFLRYMNASKFTEHFYRVRRNERQKSEICMNSINMVDT